MVVIPANVEEETFAVKIPVMVVEAEMVAAPRFEIAKKVEVAPVFVILKRSASCPFADLITRGMELTGVPVVEVASMVKTALVKGEEVPMTTWSPVVVSCTNVPESVHPPADDRVPLQTLFPEVHTLCPFSANMFPDTQRCPPKVEVAFVPLTFSIAPMEVDPVIARLPVPVIPVALTPANVEVDWFAVREPTPAEPMFTFPVVVMKPVLVMPFWVEVPETLRTPATVRLPVSLM